MKPLIAVTGATGAIGSQVVMQLLRQDQPVRALVRRLDGRAERLRAMGVEAVVADLFDPEQLRMALRGTQRAFYCPPAHPHMLDSATAFAVAAQEAGVEAVVVLTQWLASPAHPSVLTRQHFQADRMFAAISGIAHITLNPGYFAHNYLQTIDVAAQLGILPNPMGDSGNPAPANADIAAVAVGALLDPGRHQGRTYRPTGPVVLDAQQLAAVVGRVLGRTVRPIPVPPFVFAKAMRSSGFDAFMTAQTRSYISEHRRGTFAYGGPTDHVEQVTGRPAETFEATARGYAQLPGAQRTPAQLTRVLAMLARTTVTPGGDPRRVARHHGNLDAAITRLAIDDPDWVTTHTARPFIAAA